jgi:hypothetical protein
MRYHRLGDLELDKLDSQGAFMLCMYMKIWKTIETIG